MLVCYSYQSWSYTDANAICIDPKTILCVYFKAGHCDKGNKCKFSHDMNIGRKVEKKDLYSDTREEKENGENLAILWRFY